MTQCRGKCMFCLWLRSICERKSLNEREACFMCHSSWKNSTEREGNCKDWKTVIILTAIIMAKGYSPLRGGIPTNKRSAKWTHCYMEITWMILKFRSLTCLQSSVLVCKNIEPHKCLCIWALNRKHSITPSTMTLQKSGFANCSSQSNGVFQTKNSPLSQFSLCKIQATLTLLHLSVTLQRLI